MSKSRLVSLAAFVVLSAALAACGGQSSRGGSTNLSVDMSDFAYTPSAMSVPAGVEVHLSLTNSGSVDHEFVIMKDGTQVRPPFSQDDEPNVYWEAEAAAGQTGSYVFMAPSDPGQYEIVCGIPGHLEAGMEATLTVTQ